MDLIIYGERKTALEVMPQAAADCAAKHKIFKQIFLQFF